MTDFYRDQHDHSFGHACRQAELLGGITAWAQAPLHTSPAIRTTPAKALNEIRRLLAEFDVEKTRSEAVTAHDRAA